MEEMAESYSETRVCSYITEGRILGTRRRAEKKNHHIDHWMQLSGTHRGLKRRAEYMSGLGNYYESSF